MYTYLPTRPRNAKQNGVCVNPVLPSTRSARATKLAPGNCV